MSITPEDLARIKTLDLRDPIVRTTVAGFLAQYFASGGQLTPRHIDRVLSELIKHIDEVLDRAAAFVNAERKGPPS